MVMLPELWRHRGGFPGLSKDFDSLFSRFFDGWDPGPVFHEETAWAPAVNVEETEKEIIVTADLPGIDPKDVDITIEHNVLTVKGECKVEEEEKKKNYHRVERSYGSFQRSLLLPDTVESEKITATSKNGVITITLPKTRESLRKRIEVKQN